MEPISICEIRVIWCVNLTDISNQTSEFGFHRRKLSRPARLQPASNARVQWPLPIRHPPRAASQRLPCHRRRLGPLRQGHSDRQSEMERRPTHRTPQGIHRPQECSDLQSGGLSGRSRLTPKRGSIQPSRRKTPATLTWVDSLQSEQPPFSRPPVRPEPRRDVGVAAAQDARQVPGHCGPA